MDNKLKIRYYGGSYENTNRARCMSCGGGKARGRVRLMNESIQFQSDVAMNGLRTQTFQVGRDYYVTPFEAEQLLKMTFVNINGIVQNKFKVIS